MFKSLLALSLSLLAVPALGGEAPAELAAGMVAPAFEAKDDQGKTWSLAQLKGQTVVLYFYPKDDTPGCTAQAQAFRDRAKDFAAKNAVVLGVSLDDQASHQAFRAKHQLNFPLLLDGKRLAGLYGVPVRLGFASRQTFVIGPDGRLVKVFRDVNAKENADEVLSCMGDGKSP